MFSEGTTHEYKKLTLHEWLPWKGGVNSATAAPDDEKLTYFLRIYASPFLGIRISWDEVHMFISLHPTWVYGYRDRCRWHRHTMADLLFLSRT